MPASRSRLDYDVLDRRLLHPVRGRKAECRQFGHFQQDHIGKTNQQDGQRRGLQVQKEAQPNRGRGQQCAGKHGEQDSVAPADRCRPFAGAHILDEKVGRAQAGKGSEKSGHGHHGHERAIGIRAERSGDENEIGSLNDQPEALPDGEVGGVPEQAAGLHARR